MPRLRIALRRATRLAAWTLVVATLTFGYGIDADDARRLNDFTAGVERWQSGPDFRVVCDEYVRLGHDAMNCTPWGVRATTWIMLIRSVPGLPPQYAVSDTSQAHYDSFTRGELSAYLHLTGEQRIDWVIPNAELVARQGASDADVQGLLNLWKLNRPVAADSGAKTGIRRLLSDIEATRPIHVRDQVQDELATAAADLATRLGYPADPRRLSPQQQHAVYARLDADVRERNPELWRQKQISDLCSGIWAQTFGGDYVMVIGPVMTARKVARVVGPAGATGLLLMGCNGRRRRSIRDQHALAALNGEN